MFTLVIVYNLQLQRENLGCFLTLHSIKFALFCFQESHGYSSDKNKAHKETFLRITSKLQAYVNHKRVIHWFI